MNNLIKTTIHLMARRTGITLTKDHLAVLAYAYGYYERNRVGPLYQNIKKHTGLSREDLGRLFPHSLESVYAWVGIPVQSPNGQCKPLATVDVDDYREVYLDHNATTYLRKEVRKVLTDFYNDDTSFGNPGSSNTMGKRAYDVVSHARLAVARCLGARAREIVFTGSGTEANNLAIKGIAFSRLKTKGHIITSKTEHPSVLEPLRYLETLGFSVDYLDVDHEGKVKASLVARHLRKDTLLVCIMVANNEIGTINPIAEIGEVCSQAGVPLMCDAVQAYGKIPLHLDRLGISLMTMSGHKIYAPKGVGALYIRDGLPLVPLVHGGGQEKGYRSGTENVASIMAMGVAARLSCTEMENENRRLVELREFFLTEIRKVVPDVIVNGSLSDRVVNNLNIGFPDIDGGSLLLSLNRIGVYVSSGSACSAGSVEASHVIQAIGLDTSRYGVVRFSFGAKTTKDDLAYVCKYLPAIIKQLKSR